jgi:hypothetical protein
MGATLSEAVDEAAQLIATLPVDVAGTVTAVGAASVATELEPVPTPVEDQ